MTDRSERYFEIFSGGKFGRLVRVFRRRLYLYEIFLRVVAGRYTFGYGIGDVTGGLYRLCSKLKIIELYIFTGKYQ